MNPGAAASSQFKTRLFAVIVILSNTLGNFFIAQGMRRISSPVNSAPAMLKAIFTPYVAAGILLLILWLLSRMAFFSFADLSYILPVTSLGYVLNALMGHFFLGETITLQRWAGTFLIVAGTVLVGAGASHPGPGEETSANGETASGSGRKFT
jgi:uncharacterized membrane protein